MKRNKIIGTHWVRSFYLCFNPAWIYASISHTAEVTQTMKGRLLHTSVAIINLWERYLGYSVSFIPAVREAERYLTGKTMYRKFMPAEWINLVYQADLILQKKHRQYVDLALCHSLFDSVIMVQQITKPIRWHPALSTDYFSLQCNAYIIFLINHITSVWDMIEWSISTMEVSGREFSFTIPISAHK